MHLTLRTCLVQLGAKIVDVHSLLIIVIVNNIHYSVDSCVHVCVWSNNSHLCPYDILT